MTKNPDRAKSLSAFSAATSAGRRAGRWRPGCGWRQARKSPDPAGKRVGSIQVQALQLDGRLQGSRPWLESRAGTVQIFGISLRIQSMLAEGRGPLEAACLYCQQGSRGVLDKRP